MRRAITALTLVVALLPATDAMAGSQADPRPGDKQLGTKGGLAYVSDKVTSTNPSNTESDAACPKLGKGWRIAGGGFRSGDSSANILGSRSLDIYLPFGDDDIHPDDFWEVSANPAVGKKLTSYAICMKEPKLKYVQVDVPDSASSHRTSTDTCAGKGRPTGGGGLIATTGSYLSSTFPIGKHAWSIAAFDAINGFGGMTSDFACLSSRKIFQTGRSKSVHAGAVKAITAKCPAHSHVTGGGADFVATAGAGKQLASYPVDGGDRDKVPDDGWRVQGRNLTAASIFLDAWAICKG